MNARLLAASVALSFGICASAYGGQPAAAAAGISVSPELLELFRAEMRGLLSGTQAISAALPAGDWASVAATSEQMRSSYILEKELTKAQRAELAGLPQDFRIMDEQLHARADKLARAASAKDAELAAFQYGRLLETCAGCHAIYAQQRFPGFSVPAAAPHQH